MLSAGQWRADYSEGEYQAMEVSARNQLNATVKEVRRGTIMAEVVMELSDGTELVAAITASSVERLGLEAGQSVLAVVKATEVMVGRP
jgi:molybdopterin-binding protein